MRKLLHSLHPAILIPLLLPLLLPATALAHDFEVDGIYYNITGGNEVAVTYQGVNNYSEPYSGDVVIPGTVYYNGTTYTVTAIGYNAFYYCFYLTGVTMPNTINEIGAQAFYVCTSLTEVTIPNSVTSIGNFAFYNCSGLTSINIPNSVTSIGQAAFAGCSGLTSITIPNSITSISNAAFTGCSGLTSVTIPNSVTSLENSAFSDCTGLTCVTIPNSVTSISNHAFSGCSGVTSVEVASDNPIYDSRGNCNAIIETASNTLIFGCQNTVIPNSVTSIGNEAFKGCTGLTSITIPNSVTTIGNEAFRGCTGLTSITIPNSVTTLGSYAFVGCSGLTSVTVASDNPFYDSRDNCNAIIETASNTLIFGYQNTVIPNSVTSIGNNAFYNCTELTSLTLPNTLITIGNGAFYHCTGLTSINIPNAVTSIGHDAFDNCTGLTSLSLPNSLTSIGGSAFYKCTGLTSLTLSNSLTSIGTYAFYNCIGLTSINIPNSVTSIGHHAFFGCTGLTSLTLPSSLYTIGNYAFADCEALNDVYSFIYYNDDYYSMGYEVFVRSEDYSKRTLHVPYSFSGNYQQDSRWSQYFGNIVEMPSRFEVDGIYYSLINPNEVAVTYEYNHKYTGDVNIPETINYEGRTYTVTAIGDEAFESCIDLTSVSIPNSVTSIGENAFAYCYRLTEITVPESVTTIGLTTFSYCDSLTQVTWNARNCTLEYDFFDEEDHLPFAYCPSLKKITIGSEVESIDDEIFCIYEPVYNNIDTVMCLATQPPLISEDCFWLHTYENATLYVPNESVDSYASATGWKEFVHRATIEPQENILAGDVDGDGKVTIGDVADLIDYLLSGGSHVINDINADVDGDRNITIGDVADLIDKLLGKN